MTSRATEAASGLHPELARIEAEVGPHGRIRVSLEALYQWRRDRGLSRSQVARQLSRIVKPPETEGHLAATIRNLEPQSAHRLGQRRLVSDSKGEALFSPHGKDDRRYLNCLSALLTYAESRNWLDRSLRQAFTAGTPTSPGVIETKHRQYEALPELMERAREGLIFCGLSLFRGVPLSDRIERVQLFPDNLHPELERRMRADRDFNARILLVNPFSEAGRSLAKVYRPQSSARDPMRTALRTLAAFRGPWRTRMKPDQLALRVIDRVVPSAASIDGGDETLLFVPGLDTGDDRFPGLLIQHAHLEGRANIWNRLDVAWNDEAVEVGVWERNLTVEQRAFFAQFIAEEQRVLFFSYGLSMDEGEMAARCSGAIRLGIAVLPDHITCFPRQGTWLQGCVISVEPRAGHHVHGVLWSVPRRELESLDHYENTQAYRRMKILVSMVDDRFRSTEVSAETLLTQAVSVDAEVYVAFPQPGVDGIPARDGYMGRILWALRSAGYSEQVLQQRWREAFKATASPRELRVGLLTGGRQALQEGLDARFGPISDEVKAQVDQSTLNDLERWLDRLDRGVSSLEDVFES